MTCISITKKSAIRLVAVLFLISGMAGEIFSQAASQPDRGVVSTVPYDSSRIENINLQNGNVGLAIPLAALPPIAGGKLSFTLKAHYNSKLWDTYSEQRRIIPPNNNEGLQATSFFVEQPKLSDDGGWRISGKYQLSFVIPQDIYVRDTHLDPTPAEQVIFSQPWGKAYLISPDGARHELRPLNQTPFDLDPFFFGFYKNWPQTTGVATRCYTFDGSYISVMLYPPSHSLEFEANLPDGTKIQQTRTGIQRIIDTNGNKIKIFDDETGTHYQDELTGREIRVAFNPGNGTTEVWYKSVNGVSHKVEVVHGTTLVTGKFYGVNIPPIWGSQVPEACNYHEQTGAQISVIREIKFPQTETGVAQPKYSFAYNSDQTSSTPAFYTISCSNTATFPNPSIGLGELSQMTTPNGAVHKYTYSMDGEHVTSDGVSSLSAATSTITQKKVEHDGDIDIWNYTISINSGGTVTNPDGSTTNIQTYDHFIGNPSINGGSNGLGGLVYRETKSNKIRTERRWARQVFTGAYQGSSGGLVVFNPVLTHEFTSLLDDSGNVLKMSAATFEYDFNGNPTKRTDYDWFPDPSIVNRDSLGIPTAVPGNATIIRMTTRSYHNSPGTNAGSTEVYSKTSNTILNALKDTVTGNNTTRLSYDNQLHTAAPIIGNITKVEAWDSAIGDWIGMSSAFDTYGNLISKTDPNGNVITIVYGDLTHANATSTTKDPNNGTGVQTSSITYDFDTGLVLSATDVNGNISTVEYTNHLLGGAIDPFGRPGTATGPTVNIDSVNKRQITKTYYEDNARRTRIETDLFNEGDQLTKRRVTRDQIGRTILAEKNENGSSTYSISSQSVYKLQNRVTFVSNPARAGAASTDGWTRTTTDLLGRAIEVATFGGAALPPITGTNSNWTGSMTTSVVANATTVTDQAGKPERSIVDALGRVLRVDEPNNAGQLGDVTAPNQPTVYGFDVFGNLTQVTQNGTNAEQCGGPSSCSQSRTFVYSSLSRLLSATHPESGTVAYEYDAGGNLKKRTDARGVITTYLYDGLNRVKSKTYSDGTPTATYTYDSAAIDNGKGRLASATSSVSTITFDDYDAMGRVSAFTQTMGAQPYTLTFKYNLAGATTSMIYPSGRVVNYGFDTTGNLNNFSGNLGGVSRTYATGFSYDAAGRMLREQLGTDTAVYSNLFYNSRGQLAEIRETTDTDITTWNRGKIVNDYTLQCTGVGCNGSDNNGNVRRQWVSVPQDGQSPTSWYQQYEYDSLNRLTQVNENDAQSAQLWKQLFRYDRFGNRTIDVDNTSQNIPRPSYEVEIATNRLLAPGDSALAPANRKMRYDSVGNLVNDSWTAFGSSSSGVATRTFDAENRMIAAKDSDGGTTQYHYDADGHRVRRVITNKPEVWQIYGLTGELIAEYPANGAASAPQKEYGYRNGKLFITAEPGGGAGPTSLAATLHNGGPNIALSWNSTGASNYRIERSLSKNGPYTFAGATSSLTFVDNGVSNGTAYLYKVCAANAQNACTSGFSNIVLGTAITFPTDPVIKGFSEDPQNATLIKAAHINELRTAVIAVRTLAGITQTSWTNTSVSSGMLLSVYDVRELRIRLDEALLACSLNLPSYTDPILKGYIEDPQNATLVRAVHIRELRQFLTGAVGGSGGGMTSSIRWLITDQLGTPRIVFSQTGSLSGVSRHDYLPFGEELTTAGLRSTGLGYTSADTVRQKFANYERDDETGLDYAQARYYFSKAGRFVSTDPLLASGKIHDPQTWNRYTYSLNNPLKYVDPNGQIPLETIIDVASLAESFYSLVSQPSWTNAAFFVWDLVALTPYVPGSWVAKGVHKLSREAVQQSAKIASLGYKGLKAQRHTLDVKNALEVATHNDYVRKGIGLLSSGDDATRRLLNHFGGKAADFVGVTKSGTFIVADAKGINGAGRGIDQLRETTQALYNALKASGNAGDFKVATELVFESLSKADQLWKSGYGLNGNQLMALVSDANGKVELVPVMVKVFDSAGNLVKEVPVEVRFLTQ